MMRYLSDGMAADDGDDRDAELAGDPQDDESLDDELLEEDDDSLEEDFPRGDGTADTETVVYCPYCGALNEIAVDPGGGSVQSYVEDCQVCCRPWLVALAFDAHGHAAVSVEPADE